MKAYTRIALAIILSVLFISCSSTLHLYSGQQYFTDEELGTLQVTEPIQVIKFDRLEVYKTPKPPVIKALPGEHQLDLAAILSEGNILEQTLQWDAVEGHVYQLTLSDANDVIIVDITDDQVTN